MNHEADFSINELSLFYMLTHDCIIRWNEALDDGSCSGLDRNEVLDRIKMANGAARKLRKILIENEVDTALLSD